MRLRIGPLVKGGERLRPCIGPLVKGGWLRRKPQTGGLPKNHLPLPKAAFAGETIPPSRPAAVPPPFNKGG